VQKTSLTFTDNSNDYKLPDTEKAASDTKQASSKSATCVHVVCLVSIRISHKICNKCRYITERQSVYIIMYPVLGLRRSSVCDGNLILHIMHLHSHTA